MSLQLQLHQHIKEKLAYFHSINKIPNIIFNGTSGSGKSTLVNDFISLIYNENKEKIKNLVMYVNCSHGKGIKFIRDELKFFAKTHIHSNGGTTFKSIVLFNGDKLTMDAQSALRRCIELFSHNTRFFIIVEDKNKLLKPILSRFCEIYVSDPIYNGKPVNLYNYNLGHTFQFSDIKKQQLNWLKKTLNKKFQNNNTINEDNQLHDFVAMLYEKSYNALDIIKLIDDGCFDLTNNKQYELLVAFDKIRQDFRNEKLLLLFVINFTFFDKITSLENMTFI